jgi:hypothetical protein
MQEQSIKHRFVKRDDRYEDLATFKAKEAVKWKGHEFGRILLTYPYSNNTRTFVLIWLGFLFLVSVFQGCDYIVSKIMNVSGPMGDVRRRQSGQLRKNRHFEMSETDGTTCSCPLANSTLPPTKRVAIIVAGSFRRYFFQSSVDHLIKPLVKQGHWVDYYVSLTTEDAPAYRANLGYMSRLHFDPIFDDLMDRNFTIPPNKLLRTTMTKAIRKAGGRLRTLSLKHQINIDDHPLARQARKQAQQEHPREDVDLRFPVLDLRPWTAQQTATANRNLLRLHFAISRLWDRVVQTEQQDKQRYDYVLYLRDDTYWLDDFNLDKVLGSCPCQDHVYLPSCDARVPSLAAEEVNDHGLVVPRKLAGVFGNYMNELYSTDLGMCKATLGIISGFFGIRGCNSEMILRYIIESKHNMQIKHIGQGSIPFQRSAHVIGEDGSVTTCFHKFCQSHEDPLDTRDFKKCREL